MLKRPATPVPMLKKPVSKPLNTPLGAGPRAFVTPVLKKPDIRPLASAPPLAVLLMPEMKA